MNEDKKMKEWVDNKIKELKKNDEYYFERGTSHITIEDIEKSARIKLLIKTNLSYFKEFAAVVERTKYSLLMKCGLIMDKLLFLLMKAMDIMVKKLKEQKNIEMTY